MPGPSDDLDLPKPLGLLLPVEEVGRGLGSFGNIQPVQVQHARLVSVLRLDYRLGGSLVSFFHQVPVLLSLGNYREGR